MTYDLIIVGGGPAGFSCAIYAARYRIKTLLISDVFGGQILETDTIENYPGFKRDTGLNLMNTMKEQAEEFGAKTKGEYVNKIERKGKNYIVNDKYESKTIVLAQGFKRRRLNAKNEEMYHSKGVTYCATCDGPFFRDKIVGVVGGSDSAAEAALLMSQYAKKIYIIYRKDKLRAEPILRERIEKDPKIEVITNTNVVEIKGENFLQSVIFDNGKEFELSGLIVEIGHEPRTEFHHLCEVKDGLLVVDNDQSTKCPGLFAAGDCTSSSNSFNQVSTAVAEGSIAANSVYNYLKK